MSEPAVFPWHCPMCGREGSSPAPVVFHRCSRPHRRGRPPITYEEERMAWGRRLLGDALADAIDARDGGDALLRRLEESA